MPPGVDVWPVQLPGRGSRYKEPAYSSMEPLVRAVSTAIGPYLDVPFCFFGHSVGGMMSYELAHAVFEEFGAEVKHLFVSGTRAPHLARVMADIHSLPDDQFLEQLKALNGTPPEVLENPEIIRIMMTTLRADFKIAETYHCSTKPPLSCPITAFGGLEDTEVPPDALEEWKTHTTSSFDLWQLPGDHFFIHSSESLVLQVLSQQIKQLIL